MLAVLRSSMHAFCSAELQTVHGIQCITSSAVLLAAMCSTVVELVTWLHVADGFWHAGWLYCRGNCMLL
jgi:hypothetical protein